MTSFMLALALGMDAFSVGLVMGLRMQRILLIVQTSLLVGFFHLWMPLVGIFFGGILKQVAGSMALFVAAGLLVLLGAHMLLQILLHKSEKVSRTYAHSLFGLLAFAFSVSVDSLSVGISIGTLGSNMGSIVLVIAVTAAMMTGLGLWLGKRLRDVSGRVGEVIAGIVLLTLGLKTFYEYFF